MEKNKRGIVISTNTQKESGVGGLLSMLTLCESLKLLTPKSMKSEYAFFKILNRILLYVFYTYLFLLRNKTITIVHFQSISYLILKRLLKRNKVNIYVVDNSFFCVKSYNHLVKYDECFLCLKMNSINSKLHKCKVFPSKYSREKSIKYMELIFNHKSNVKFLVQNIDQGRLLDEHFGKNINIKHVGMVTLDIIKLVNEEISLKQNYLSRIVYHGSLNSAKGIQYVIELANVCPEIEFIIPYSVTKVQEKLKQTSFTKNIFFKDITWQNGLEEYCRNSKMVICPSLWSSPIESAFVKSTLVNGNVAYLKRTFSYASEQFANIMPVLTGNILKDSDTIKKHFEIDLNERYNRIQKSKEVTRANIRLFKKYFEV